MRRKAGRAQKFLITIGGYQRAKCEGACECDVEVDGEETKVGDDRCSLHVMCPKRLDTFGEHLDPQAARCLTIPGAVTLCNPACGVNLKHYMQEYMSCSFHLTLCPVAYL
jgi:hypothetical protein